LSRSSEILSALVGTGPILILQKPRKHDEKLMSFILKYVLIWG